MPALANLPLVNRLAAWRDRPVVAVVRLTGVIGPSSGPMRPSLNLASLAGVIEQAFRQRGLKAVALAINSPGGSPVQSALVHDRIRALADEKHIPVYAFCEDVAASGGYWLACAGDEIYANATSIVGSIGVISGGFGFDKMLHKLGIDRRIYTAGEKKAFLDPFQAENEADVRRLKALQKEIHDQFKAHVRGRRGDRLQGTDRKLFSGEFWTGESALPLGLVDGIGELRQTMRAKFGPRTRFKVLQPGRSWLQRRLGLAAEGRGGEGWSDGLNLADGLVAAIERRALWSRYGL
jgi:signal peptide peptidase SppA